MLRMRNLSKSSVLFLIAFAALVLLAAPAVEADCTWYLISEAVYISGYGVACGGSGDGCTECSDPVSGDSCVFDGVGSCDWTPENQW